MHPAVKRVKPVARGVSLRLNIADPVHIGIETSTLAVARPHTRDRVTIVTPHAAARTPTKEKTPTMMRLIWNAGSE
jgi:hypothetical protein